MKCNKKNCPLVGNNENCDIKECKWRTEDAVDSDLIRRSDAIRAMEKLIEAEGTMDYAEWDFPTSYKQERINQTEACIDQIRYIPAVEPKQGEWIPCEERMPEEHEWIGTKRFGTTISDEVHITFDVNGERFVRTLSLQNGELSNYDKQTMDAVYKGWKMVAWMPLPEPYMKGADDD